MNTSEWILIGLWIFYYTLHSLFASARIKTFFKIKLGKYFRYYRLAYSAFALIALVALLIYQYSFYSPFLFKSLVVQVLAAIFLVFPGILIMLISIKKYFMLLSGIRSIFTPIPSSELKINGIHQYVRHPLYSGTILFVAGLFFIFPTLTNLIAATLLILYVLIGIIFEEKKLVKEFGADYLRYMENVPKLIPSFQRRKK